MLESLVQTRLVHTLKKSGWLVCKQNLTSIPGWPDLLCLRNGKIVFVEVKREGQKPRPLQSHCHDKIRCHGGIVVVYDGSEIPKELI